MLQEVLRLEQVSAREALFQEEMRAGKGYELPDLSEQAKDAKALIALLESSNRSRAAPAWLVALRGPEGGHYTHTHTDR